MADLDPGLQKELTEFIAHKNRQQRAARKYGPYVLLAFFAFVAAMFAWSHYQTRKMEEDYDRDVEKMHRDYQQRVDDMHRRQQEFIQQNSPPSPPSGPRP